MQSTQDRFISIAATAIFHLLVVIFLLLYYIHPSASLNRVSEEFEGVPVMFGNVPDAYGNDEPYGRGSNTPQQTEPSATEAPNQAATPTQSPSRTESPVVSQDFEETVAIREAKKKEDEKKKQEAFIAEQKRKEKAEADRIAAAETRQRQNISSEVNNLFGNGSGSGSRGNTTGSGTQGVPTGNASYGKTSGVGGWGDYDLGGRGVGKGGLIQPQYTTNDYGTVVIDIIVDPQGNVVEATIGRGTNSPSSTLKNEALKAARKTKFTTVTKAGNQKGTITYKFNLN